MVTLPGCPPRAVAVPIIPTCEAHGQGRDVADGARVALDVILFISVTI
jgi:hypothetical protein